MGWYAGPHRAATSIACVLSPTRPLTHHPSRPRARSTAEKWDRKYSREKAAFPTAWVRESKFWPTVGRVDNVYGDRNLQCTCPPLTDYQ